MTHTLPRLWLPLPRSVSFTHTHTHTLTHTHTYTLSHVPFCWHVHRRQSVFIRSPPGLRYLELLMQWAMWTWNWKQMLNTVAKSLWLPRPYRLLPMGLSVCVCVCVCVCACEYSMSVCLIKETIFWMTFGIWVDCVSHKPKDFLEPLLHCFHQMLSRVLCCAACLGCDPRHENLVNTWPIWSFFAYVSYYPNAALLCRKITGASLFIIVIFTMYI